MAASDTQVALSRIQRGASSGMSRATRQAVAPFLQKLYEMVSDSATDNLIRWSNSGDSFFVLDHERVAHDVLPRWFKHSNFASFVRQLNMYGFHKIPHLQQGVLKSDTETELWNFEHPNFHRGQPDLLCLIMRKKQAADRPVDETPIEPREANAFPATTANGSVVDVNSIVNGIGAIKRHQAAISADLNDLKISNQHLWQETLAARERHNKHQDTINKILKFLASVFGNSASPHKGAPGEDASHSSILRKRQRLMIEDGSSSGQKGLSTPIAGHMENESAIEALDDIHSTPTTRFTTLENAQTEPTTTHISDPFPQTAIPDGPAPSPKEASSRILNVALETPSSSTTLDEGAPIHEEHLINSTPLIDSSQNMLAPISQAQTNNPDAVLQAILNSPQQLQKLLGVLNLQQNFPGGPSFDAPQPQPPPNAIPVNDSSVFANSSFSPVPASVDLVEPLDDSPNYLSLLRNEDNTNYGPILDNTSRFHKTYKDASDITADVDALQSSIDALIENLGLNPGGLDTSNTSGNAIPPDEDPILNRGASSSSTSTFHDEGGQSHSTESSSTSTVPDFDVEAFFRELNRHNSTSDASTSDNVTLDGNSNGNTFSDRLGAYVDEINSQSDAASPATTKASLDDVPPSHDVHVPMKKGSKRKSNVTEIPPEADAAPRSKRKR